MVEWLLYDGLSSLFAYIFIVYACRMVGLILMIRVMFDDKHMIAH